MIINYRYNEYFEIFLSKEVIISALYREENNNYSWQNVLNIA